MDGFTTDVEALNFVLFLARLAAGVTLFLHGYQKMFLGGKLEGTAGWFESLGMKPGHLHARLASTTEQTCGALMVLGLLTPFAAAGFIGIMVVAAHTDHRGKGFFMFKNGWEYVFIFGCFVATLATIGPGEWSLDAVLDIDYFGWTGLFIAAGLGLGAGYGTLAVFHTPPEEAGA